MVWRESNQALKVTIDAKRRHLITQLHQRSNYGNHARSILALEYYDSPSDPRLQDVADTYVLDYSPEFAEGLGIVFW